MEQCGEGRGGLKPSLKLNFVWNAVWFQGHDSNLKLGIKFQRGEIHYNIYDLFNGSECGISVTSGSKQVKLLLTPELDIFTSKVSMRWFCMLLGQPLGQTRLFSLHHTPLLLLSAKRYTTLSLLFMSNQMWCQSNLHRDIISFNTSSLNSFWLANSDWVSA